MEKDEYKITAAAKRIDEYQRIVYEVENHPGGNRVLKQMKLFLALLVAWAAAGQITANACTKPVFRYALERWPASPFHLAVLHDAPLDDAVGNRLESLYPEDSYGLSITAASVTNELPDGGVKDAWQANADPERLPLGVLQTPFEYGTTPTVLWQGSLDAAGVKTLKGLIYPPAVRKVLASIAAGDTAAWLLLNGPDEKANRRFRNRLEKSLTALEKELKLPHELDASDTEYDGDLAPGVPMKLKFSILDADIEQPGMQLLKRTLEAAAPDIMDTAGPLAIPIFARGRALAIFTPEELTEDVLAEVCHFLVGPCSCRVKSLNPGFDLLMPFPWERTLWDEALNAETVLKGLAPAETSTPERKHLR